MTKAATSIWEGHFDSFPPAKGPCFDSPNWSKTCYKRISAPAQPPEDCSGFLFSTVALRLSQQRRVRVLDFGGGPGATFASLVAALPPRARLDFRVVESLSVCEVGRTRFRSDSRIQFHSALPTMRAVDIVHAQSSFQYVRDWRGLFGRLSEFQAPIFIVTDLPAGAFRTYAAHQNYYDSRIPCWFFNLSDFISVAKLNGYRLLSTTKFLGRYLGEYQDMPQLNYPPPLRVGKSWNLLFSRERPR